ncbi:hypothetical protein M0R45_016010 [Rubus argutus]|uniref:Uncharacterized protein n=1 Tax=Rubus argutus TaxID=59490 RepID=A0AAW1XSN9_RUBAR
MITSENAAENPTAETDPDSALIVHGLELLHQATEVVAVQNRQEEASNATVADVAISLPPETPSEEELPQCEPQEVPNVANVLAYEAAPESQANESESVRMSEQTEPTTRIRSQEPEETLPLVLADEATSAQPELTFEERLKLLLEPEQHQETIEIAKGFLSNLGTANFDDPAVIPKIREYAAFLQKHLVGEELATANALMLKMELLPPLQANARQWEEVVLKKQAVKATEEAKANEVRENSANGEPISSSVMLN